MPADSPKQKPAIAAFISYAKADQEKAQAIADQLEERGFRCWIAPRDVKPGRAYGDEIIRGIEGARCLVLVLSSASNGSGFVSREIERAVSKNKPIFTIRIEDVEPAPALELFISSTQWIDAFDGGFEERIDRLASFLTEEEGQGAPPTERPRFTSSERKRRPPWLFLGLGAAVLAGLVLGGLWLMRPKSDPGFDQQACLNFSGETAVAACDRAIASGAFKDHKLATLFAKRGYERQVENDLDAALADYGKALAADPALALAFNNRGNIYRDKGDYGRALGDYDQALALDPSSADAYASRGWIYLQQKKPELAARDFEAALGLDPSAPLKRKLEAALGKAKESAGRASDDGLFGPDTRKSIAAFPADEAAKLAARYAYVGTLLDSGDAVCNATLVGASRVLTSDYCFAGRDPAGMLFRVLDREGRPFESKIADVAVSAPIRGAATSQRVAVASLADPLGDQVGWVKTLGGSPSIGQKLDIVAIDVRQAAEGEETTVAGASTGDRNCAVLARDANSDTFGHRCISPPGSGGAPIFDAASGSLLGIVGETDSRRRMGIAYRIDGAPGLGGLASVTCTVSDPTGTPLNVRNDPNGDVVGTLANGVAVAVVESRIAANGKPWVKVADPKTQGPIGWVFRDFVSCS